MNPAEYILGLPKKELAALAGSIPISLGYLKSVVKGKKSCRISTIQAICGYSEGKVTVQEWFDWLNEEKGNE